MQTAGAATTKGAAAAAASLYIVTAAAGAHDWYYKIEDVRNGRRASPPPANFETVQVGCAHPSEVLETVRCAPLNDHLLACPPGFITQQALRDQAEAYLRAQPPRAAHPQAHPQAQPQFPPGFAAFGGFPAGGPAFAGAVPGLGQHHAHAAFQPPIGGFAGGVPFGAARMNLTPQQQEELLRQQRMRQQAHQAQQQHQAQQAAQHARQARPEAPQAARV